MSIIAKFKALAKGKEVRGGSFLVISSVVAQLVTLAVTPILARVYEANAFGYLTLVVSVTGMITPAVSLRLESALMLPKRAEEASALLFLGLIAAASISILSAIVLELLFRAGLFEAMARLPAFSAWVGGITFFSGAFVVVGQFALRARNYAAVAIRNLTQAVTTAFAQLGLAVVTPFALGLIGGYGAGRVAGVLPLVASVKGELRRFSYADILQVAREYRAFPLLFAPAALMNAAALSLPILAAGLWFDVADAGQWGMAERILAVPLVIIGTAVSQVVEARLALHVRTDRAGSAAYYLKVSFLLLAASLVIGLMIFVLAPVLIPIILGPGWSDASFIMQLLIPMLMTRLIASPLSKALIVANWAKLNLLLDASRLILVVLVLAMCWSSDATMEQLVLSVSVVFAIVYAATWFAGLAAVRRLDRGNQQLHLIVRE